MGSSRLAAKMGPKENRKSVEIVQIKMLFGSFDFEIEKLTRDNFDTWKMQAKAALVLMGLWGYVTGKIVKPEEINVEDWIKKDQQALDMIKSLIMEEEIAHVKDVKSSKEAFEKIKQVWTGYQLNQEKKSFVELNQDKPWEDIRIENACLEDKNGSLEAGSIFEGKIIRLQPGELLSRLNGTGYGEECQGQGVNVGHQEKMRNVTDSKDLIEHGNDGDEFNVGHQEKMRNVKDFIEHGNEVLTLHDENKMVDMVQHYDLDLHMGFAQQALTINKKCGSELESRVSKQIPNTDCQVSNFRANEANKAIEQMDKAVLDLESSESLEEAFKGADKIQNGYSSESFGDQMPCKLWDRHELKGASLENSCGRGASITNGFWTSKVLAETKDRKCGKIKSRGQRVLLGKFARWKACGLPVPETRIRGTIRVRSRTRIKWKNGNGNGNRSSTGMETISTKLKIEDSLLIFTDNSEENLRLGKIEKREPSDRTEQKEATVREPTTKGKGCRLRKRNKKEKWKNAETGETTAHKRGKGTQKRKKKGKQKWETSQMGDASQSRDGNSVFATSYRCQKNNPRIKVMFLPGEVVACTAKGKTRLNEANREETEDRQETFTPGEVKELENKTEKNLVDFNNGKWTGKIRVTESRTSKMEFR